MQPHDSIKCSREGCRLAFRPGEYLQDGEHRRPYLRTPKSASTIEQAVAEAVCAYCADEAATVPLWDAVNALGATLGPAPWVTAPKMTRTPRHHRAAKAPSKPEKPGVLRTHTGSIPKKPEGKRTKSPPPPKPSSGRGSKQRMPDRPTLSRGYTSAAPHADSRTTLASVIPHEIAKWTPKKGACLVMDERGEPEFVCPRVAKSGVRKVRSGRSGQCVLTVDPGEEVRIDHGVSYVVHRPDTYPSGTPDVELKAEGVQERKPWMPEGLAFDDLVLFDETGEPCLIRKGERLEQLEDNRIRLPDGKELKLFWDQKGENFFTAGEILWDLLSRAVRTLGEEHELTQTLLGVMWLLCPTTRRVDVVNRLNYLDRLAARETAEVAEDTIVSSEEARA